MDDIKNLKRVRTKLGVTQGELAKKAGISQSLIAKVESGKLDPSYSKARRILDTLYSLQRDDEPTAKSIMKKRVVLVKSSESLKSVVGMMKSKGYSQLPVVKNNKVIGFLSEHSILKSLLEDDKPKKIVDVMEPTPPILPPSTKRGVLANLLRDFPLVLIEEKGKVVGIVTKYDLIDSIYR